MFTTGAPAWNALSQNTKAAQLVNFSWRKIQMYSWYITSLSVMNDLLGQLWSRISTILIVVEKDLDVLCLTETWLRETGDKSTIGDLVPPGCSFLPLANWHYSVSGGLCQCRSRAMTLTLQWHCQSHMWLTLTPARGNGHAASQCSPYRPTPSQWGTADWN